MSESDERMIIFGDLHGNWQAASVILDYARQEGINTALNLGDEAPHTNHPTAVQDLEAIYRELRIFRDEAATRTLICVVGNHTVGIPSDLLSNYCGVSPDGEVDWDSVFFVQNNIIAGHIGSRVLEKYQGVIEGRSRNDRPLAIFHGHSHSMGVLPNYRILPMQEMVYVILEGEQRIQLSSGETYWINPGANNVPFPGKSGYFEYCIANFAVYNPRVEEIILKSVRFDPDSIKPSV